MTLGQDVFHAIKALEYFQGGNQKTPDAVRMLIVWVPTTSKANYDDVALADHVKKWYELESYGTLKQADLQSAADKCAQKTLDTTTLHDASRYIVRLLSVEDNIHLPVAFTLRWSSLSLLKSV